MSDPKFPRHGTVPTVGSAAPGTPRSATQPAQPARPQTSPVPPTAADPKAPRTGSSSGRVTHDERGNAVWEWVTTATRKAILSATSLLKKLDSSELSLEETPSDKEKSAMLPEKRPGGGFNPYEQASKPRGKK
jgi:hypothetical protein